MKFLKDSSKDLTEEQIKAVIQSQSGISGVYDDLDITVGVKQSKTQVFERMGQILKGRVTLIANAAFEAKQLGAQLNSIIEEGVDNLLQDSTEQEPEKVVKLRKQAKQEIPCVTRPNSRSSRTAKTL